MPTTQEQAQVTRAGKYVDPLRNERGVLQYYWDFPMPVSEKDAMEHWVQGIVCPFDTTEFSYARYQLNHGMAVAHASISKTKVGAIIAARNKNGRRDYFTAGNVELSSNNFGWHAEESAFLKAVSNGYPYVEAVFVTSESVAQQAALCGRCMQIIKYANPYAFIFVFNPYDPKNETPAIKIATTVYARDGPLGYWGRGRLEL